MLELEFGRTHLLSWFPGGSASFSYAPGDGSYDSTEPTGLCEGMQLGMVSYQWFTTGSGRLVVKHFCSNA